MVDDMKEIGMTAAEFERQFRKASRYGNRQIEDRVKASRVRFDRKSKRLVIEMKNGVILLVPVDLIQGLQNADAKALSDIALLLAGTQIHWKTLDVQFYVEDLLRGIFGTPNWMSSLSDHLSEIGRKGGSARSSAKRAASAENGRKGGRPPAKRTA